MKKLVKISRILLILFSLNLSGGLNPVYGGTLPLPQSAESIIKQIMEKCPDCLEKGFAPSGNAEIGFGKFFFSNFFIGQPETGALVSYVMSGEKYLANLKTYDLKSSKARLYQRFEKTRLFLIEKFNYKVHIIDQPEEVVIVIPATLHKCLYQTDKPLCCCCTASCESECCEKKLGSSYVRIRWNHPFDTSQKIVYTYYPTAGTSQIYFTDETGNKKDIRWCLDSAGPGFLKITEYSTNIGNYVISFSKGYAHIQPNTTDQALLQVVKTGHGHLSLDGNRVITDKGIKDLGAAVKGLRLLNMMQIKGDSLKDLSNLGFLYLENCPNIHDSSIANLPTLKQLYLRNMPQISDTAVRRIRDRKIRVTDAREKK